MEKINFDFLPLRRVRKRRREKRWRGAAGRAVSVVSQETQHAHTVSSIQIAPNGRRPDKGPFFFRRDRSLSFVFVSGIVVALLTTTCNCILFNFLNFCSTFRFPRAEHCSSHPSAHFLFATFFPSSLSAGPGSPSSSGEHEREKIVCEPSTWPSDRQACIKPLAPLIW